MTFRTKSNLSHAGMTLAAACLCFWKLEVGVIATGSIIGVWVSLSKPVETFCNKLTEAAKKASLQ